MSRIRRSNNFLFRCCRKPSIGNICGNRIVEKQYVLADQRNIGAKTCQRDLFKRISIDQYAALGRVKKTRDQARERGFAASRGAYECNRFARLYDEPDIVKRHRHILLVAEANMIKLYASF